MNRISASERSDLTLLAALFCLLLLYMAYNARTEKEVQEELPAMTETVVTGETLV